MSVLIPSVNSDLLFKFGDKILKQSVPEIKEFALLPSYLVEQ